MVSRTLLLCVSLAVLPTVACGQNQKSPADSSPAESSPAVSSPASADPITRAEFDELARSVQANITAVNQLTDNVTKLTNQLTADREAPADSPAGASEATDSPAATPSSGLAPTAYELAAKVRELQEQIDLLTEIQRNHETQLGQIATRDQDGSYYPRMNAKSTAAREEFRQATRDAAPEQGELVVNNRMDADQFLYVEGDGYRVKAGETRRIPVRRGTIESNLPGQERVLWTIVAPDYQQTIDIRPRETAPTTVNRAPDLATPIYYDPWTGISYVAN